MPFTHPFDGTRRDAYPELVTWSNTPTEAIQRRISFALLNSSLLGEHVSRFGKFCIEVEPDVLPFVSVAYVPDASSELITTLASVQQTLQRMWQLKQAAETALPDTQPIIGLPPQVLLQTLNSLSADPHEQLLGLISVANLLCRTGRLGKGDQFAYWTQREWRLTDSFVPPKWRSNELTDEEKEAVRNIDPEFFNKQMQPLNETAPLGSVVDECRILRPASGNKRMIEYASRFICPEEHCKQATAIFAEESIELQVVPLEEVL